MSARAALAATIARLRAADARARAYQAGGAPALLALLHRQLAELATAPDPLLICPADRR